LETYYILVNTSHKKYIEKSAAGPSFLMQEGYSCPTTLKMEAAWSFKMSVSNHNML